VKKEKENGLYKLQLSEIPRPKIEADNVLVQISSAALNHRDVWITKGLYPGIKFDSVLGSDGSGIVVEVANSKKHAHLIGKRVIINSSVGWEDEIRGPTDGSFGILGLLPFPGTFADFISVPANLIQEVPGHLTLEQAAAIPLAGLTAYRALVTKGNAQSGSNVLITGIGGGVALFALQFAIALGANVWVTSSSEEKIAKSINLGALGGVNYTKAGWEKELQSKAGLFDLIVDGAGGSAIQSYFKLVNIGGVISLYGSTAGVVENANLAVLFLKNAELRGTSMGSNKEFKEMIELINQKKIVPIVDSVTDFEKSKEAFHLMREGKQFGKILIKFNSLENKSKL